MEQSTTLNLTPHNNTLSKPFSFMPFAINNKMKEEIMNDLRTEMKNEVSIMKKELQDEFNSKLEKIRLELLESVKERSEYVELFFEEKNEKIDHHHFDFKDNR